MVTKNKKQAFLTGFDNCCVERVAWQLLKQSGEHLQAGVNIGALASLTQGFAALDAKAVVY